MLNVGKIISIESEFDNIYRITTNDGLILDIFEHVKPIIGGEIEYNFGKNIVDIPSNFNIMNGIVYNVSPGKILVSFGGLLGSIPVTDFFSKDEEITLIYKL